MNIVTLTDALHPEIIEAVRALFRQYAAFLRSSNVHSSFGFARLEQETATLPDPYVANNGEVLVAIGDSGSVTGCVAYRSLRNCADPGYCEIKRLFVASNFRGRGIGRDLIAVAMDRARHRGYQWACLDTEPHSMANAHRLYLELGFTEYDRKASDGGPALVLLRKPLA